MVARESGSVSRWSTSVAELIYHALQEAHETVKKTTEGSTRVLEAVERGLLLVQEVI